MQEFDENVFVVVWVIFEIVLLREVKWFWLSGLDLFVPDWFFWVVDNVLSIFEYKICIYTLALLSYFNFLVFLRLPTRIHIVSFKPMTLINYIFNTKLFMHCVLTYQKPFGLSILVETFNQEVGGSSLTWHGYLKNQW